MTVLLKFVIIAHIYCLWSIRTMSEVIDGLSKILEELEVRLKTVIEESEDIIEVWDVRLNTALKNQVRLEHKWNPLKADVMKLLARAKFVEETELNNGITSAMKDNYRSSSITEAKELGKSSLEYRKAKRLVIEVTDMLEEVNAYVETITSRRYVLNNITNATIASVENSLI